MLDLSIYQGREGVAAQTTTISGGSQPPLIQELPLA
jgi:hypothetical protein